MREFTIEDLINIFRENIVVIVLAVICAVIAGFLYSTKVVTPLYESSAKIILVKQDSSIKENITGYAELTTNDITFNQKLVSTYSEIIKSRSVLDQVRQNLNLNISNEALKNSIVVSPVEDTEVINISVKGENSEQNSNIVNAIVAVFTSEVKRIYNIDNVKIVDKAIPNNEVVNISKIKNMGLFGIAAAVLVYGLFFLKEYLNNKISRVEDLEALQLNVLTSIPNFEKMKGARR